MKNLVSVPWYVLGLSCSLLALPEAWAAVPSLTPELSALPRQFHLSWPNSVTGSVLWSAADLRQRVPWSPITNTAVDDGQAICVTLAPDAGQRFFCLAPGPQGMPAPKPIKPVFVTAVGTREEERAAELLADSIRAFGGAYRSAPIYVFLANPTQAPGTSLVGRVTQTLPLEIASQFRSFPFATKVHAAAQMETLMAGKAEWVVWFDPKAVMLAPPMSLEVPASIALAIRPVHYRNVGLSTRQSPDTFWRTIYGATGVDTNKLWSVQSFVDGQEIWAYYNCAFMACRPELGLFREWRDVFQALLSDPVSRSRVAADSQHSTYLHQTILSALILARLRQDQINTLPISYGYPTSVQSSIPQSRRLNHLSQLSVALYEGSLSSCLSGITLDPEFKPWLAAHGITR